MSGPACTYLFSVQSVSPVVVLNSCISDSICHALPLAHCNGVHEILVLTNNDFINLGILLS